MKKKFISILLCLTMILQGSLPGFAEEFIVWDEESGTAGEAVFEEMSEASPEAFGDDLIIDDGLFEDVSPDLSEGDGALAGELTDESETAETETLESETEEPTETEMEEIQESESSSEESLENGAMPEYDVEGLIEEESESEALLEDASEDGMELIFTTETVTLADPTVAHGTMPTAKYRMLRNTAQYNGCYGNQLSGAAREIYNERVNYFVTNRQTGQLRLEYTSDTSPITFTAKYGNGDYVNSDEYLAFKTQVGYALQASLDAFLYDHPEVFWAKVINGNKITYGVGGILKGDTITGYISYIPIEFAVAFSNADTMIAAYDEAVPKVAEQIQAQADANGDGQITDAELVLEIHDYLGNRFVYATEEYKNYQTTGDYRIFCSAGAFLDSVGTRVVCEGYAKSFKVLCDQFGIPCVLIGGKAVADNVGHMWNGVKLGGKWYFTDVTWDDPTGGTVTHNNFLIGTVTDRISSGNFSGSSNTNTFVYPGLEAEAYAGLDGVAHNPQVKSVIQSTCVSGGYTEYGCSDRGCRYYRTDNYTEVNPEKHNIKEQVVPGTCTEQAYTLYTCMNGCNYAIKDNYMEKDPDNHNYVISSVTVPTCTSEGYTTYTCERCSDSYNDHFIAKDVNNHDYRVTETVLATCTVNGYTTYICSRCSQGYKKDDAKALNHSYKSVVTAPTCKKGYTTYTCTRSGCKHSFVGNEQAALGYHPYKNGICPGCGQGDTITKATISKLSSYGYDPKGVEPEITVKFGTNVLKEGTDYTVTYRNNTELGTAWATIAGIGKYRGTVSKSFKIIKRVVGKLTFPEVADKTYTGKAIKPAITIRNNGTKLVKDIDYTVKYSNNKNIGRASITIKLKGNYSGTQTIYFHILPKAVSIKTVKSTAKKKMKVTWKKVTGGSSYQLQYSLNSNFSGAKTVTVGASNSSKTLTKLTSKKMYYVRIRSYKKVSGKKYYSEWSKAKKVTIK